MKKITDPEGIIRSMYGQGYSVGAIGRAIGRETASVANTLARLGLRERIHPDRLTSEEKAEIAAAYRAGVSSSVIAKKYGKTPDTIREAARAAGVMIFGRGNRTKEFTEAEQVTMRTMWDLGESHYAIACALGTTRPRVSSFMRVRMGCKDARRASGPRHGSWAGGRRIKEGYVQILLSSDDPLACMRGRNGYVPEHRLVMARAFGRPLRREETIHHINGDKLDNRPENLEVHQGKHGSGVSYQCCNCGSRNVQPVELTTDMTTETEL